MEVRLIEASECRGAKRPTAADYWPLPASKTESAIDGGEECARRAMPDLNNRKQEAAGSAARTRSEAPSLQDAVIEEAVWSPLARKDLLESHPF